jgi:site-specific recombinase XerD
MNDAPDLAALVTSWELALRGQNKSRETLRKYLTGVRFFIRWCLDNGHVPALDGRLVSTWIAELLAGGAEPATAQARLLALKRFSAWLTEEGELDADPVVGIKPPKLDVKVVPALTDDQLRALIKACEGKEFPDRRDEAIVRLMAETGLRAAEVCALTVADMDLGRGLAVVQRGKGGKGRVVQFGAQTATALDRYIRARRRHRLADTDALWLGDRGRTFAYSGLYGMLNERATRAGIGAFHPHQLRNTFATRWLAARGSEGGLMAMAGWSRREMIDRYTRATAASRAAEESRNLNLGDL